MSVLVNADTGEVVSHSLAECEQIIERGLTSFIEVGNALMTIRDDRLYKASHSDFDAYCQERWGWNRAHAYRMIGAAEVVEDLSPIGDIAPPPQNEAQARPLGKLPTPEQRREAWGEANRKAQEEERPVRARDVEDAVRDRITPPTPVTPDQQRAIDIAAANERDAKRLTLVVAHWDLVTNFRDHSRRADIVALMHPEDRLALTDIEETIHA